MSMTIVKGIYRGTIIELLEPVEAQNGVEVEVIFRESGEKEPSYIISHAMNSMSDRIFIDTNILFYAYDQDAGAKHEIAKKLIGQCWEQANGVLSIQVLCEFFV